MRSTSCNGHPAHQLIVAFLHNDQGLTITEYAVAAGLIAATIAVAFSLLGTTINTLILAVTAFM